MIFLARAYLALCFVSLPTFLYVMGQGMLRVYENFGMVTLCVVTLFIFPALFGIGLLIDGREARDRQRQFDQHGR